MNRQRQAVSVFVIAALAAGVGGCGNDSPATTVPETTVSTTTLPESTVPATMPPESTAPPASAPEATPPQGSSPDSSLPTVSSASAVLVGLTQAQAEEAAADHGWTIRVIRLDGQDRPMTMDYRPDRVNVAVTDGNVTAVISTG